MSPFLLFQRKAAHSTTSALFFQLNRSRSP